jgi:AbrB family looped-hinge helix DNA binding protein
MLDQFPESMKYGGRLRKSQYLSIAQFFQRGNGASSLEKHIKVSTQGRLTIPKQIRDSLRISDGQPVVIRLDRQKREIVIILQPVISDYK